MIETRRRRKSVENSRIRTRSGETRGARRAVHWIDITCAEVHSLVRISADRRSTWTTERTGVIVVLRRDRIDAILTDKMQRSQEQSSQRREYVPLSRSPA